MAWTANAAQLLTQASAPPMFPEGRPPAVGQRISRPFLDGSLWATAAGPDAFYLDRVGSAIPEATGNLITRDDLSRCQARWVVPLSAALFGRTAWTTPPNSQGYLTLATLSIFEQLDPTMDPEHPDYWHALIEAYRSMAWERDHCLYDPDTGPDRGHRISIDRSWEPDWGPISAISLSPNGLREAVADPRVETALALSL